MILGIPFILEVLVELAAFAYSGQSATSMMLGIVQQQCCFVQKQNAAIKRRFVYSFVYRNHHLGTNKAILERATRLELVTSTLAR
jgi:hypothetical protein